MLDRAPVPDGCLVRQIAGGDSLAVQQLYSRHAASVYALAYAVLMDSEDADYVVNQTFDRARAKAAEYDPAAGGANSWLAEMARSIAQALSVTRRAERASGPFTLT